MRCQSPAREIAHRFRKFSARALMATSRDAGVVVDLAAAISKIAEPK